MAISSINTSSVDSDRGEDHGLLLDTSETLLEMVESARANITSDGSGEEMKIFYSHLAFHCIRLRDHLRRTGTQPTSSRLSEEHASLISQALRHLGCLVPESGPQKIGPFSSTSLVFRLKALNLYWSEARKLSDQEKHAFTSRWLVPPASTDHRNRVDEDLEKCVDHIDKYRPEPFAEKSTDDPASLKVDEPSYVIWEAAESVFDALLDCKSCTCHTDNNFGAKLQLGTYRKPKDSNPKASHERSSRNRLNRLRKSRGDEQMAFEVDLDMFLSMEQDWHEVHVQVAKQRSIRFDLPGDAESPAAVISRSSGKNVRVERLCEPIAKIKSRALQRLLLKLSNGHLFETSFEKSNFHVDKTSNPISLAQCFETRQDFFTEKMKRILSLIIGSTVLHLHGTSWLRPGWGSANIKFFRTTSFETPMRPFIQAPLAKDTSTRERRNSVPSEGNGGYDDATVDDLNAGHRCPVLIALSVVLMEVYFVKPFKKLAEMHSIPLIEESSGATLIDVDQVFNGEYDEDGDLVQEGWRTQIPEDSSLLAAIDKCLDVELWEDEDGNTLDPKLLRSRIYQEVVRPLEKHLADGFSQIPLDSVDKHARNLDFGKWGQVITSQQSSNLMNQSAHSLPQLVRAGSPAYPLTPPSQFAIPFTGNNTLQHNFSYPRALSADSCMNSSLYSISTCNNAHTASQLFDDEVSDVGASVAGTESYRRWRTEYVQVYDKFIAEYLPGTPDRPVKVAILDTGFNKDNYTYEARAENFKGERNCFDKSQADVSDRHGHGTLAANLILDYAPDASLYIVKIAGKDNSRPDAKIVANAITYAVNEWEVDVISMSFGWPSSNFDGQDLLQDAIDLAHSKKVLLFAAASNSGGRLGRAYPASSKSQVICVHSTDTWGNRSDFSPTAEPNAINIATVGQSVCRDKMDRARSGTSYATPIAVGIAAFFLQYGRLHLNSREALEMKRKDKMEALLRRCAQRGPNYQPRDDYFFVHLSLHHHNLFGQSLEGTKNDIIKTLMT